MRGLVWMRRGLAPLMSVTVIAFSSTFAGADETREYGAYLSSECVTCHRAGASGDIPSLVGRHRDEIVAALGAFKSGARQSAVMQQIASQLAEDEVAALAEYFSSLTIECRTEVASGQDKPC